MNTSRVLGKLKAVARRWGGELRAVTEDEYGTFADLSNRVFSEAPFASGCLGVVYAKKLVVYVPGTGDVEPVGIIHELGHAFSSRRAPDSCKEYGFFGWEYALARQVGITRGEWCSRNKDYQVGYKPDEKERALRGPGAPLPFAPLGALTKAQRDWVIRDRTTHAVKTGRIVNGRPVPLR